MVPPGGNGTGGPAAARVAFVGRGRPGTTAGPGGPGRPDRLCGSYRAPAEKPRPAGRIGLKAGRGRLIACDPVAPVVGPPDPFTGRPTPAAGRIRMSRTTSPNRRTLRVQPLEARDVPAAVPL